MNRPMQQGPECCWIKTPCGFPWESLQFHQPAPPEKPVLQSSALPVMLFCPHPHYSQVLGITQVTRGSEQRLIPRPLTFAL